MGLKKSMKNRKNPIFRNLLTKTYKASGLTELPASVDWR